jgi:Cdc6-like AAA superfamily ATPase
VDLGFLSVKDCAVDGMVEDGLQLSPYYHDGLLQHTHDFAMAFRKVRPPTTPYYLYNLSPLCACLVSHCLDPWMPAYGLSVSPHVHHVYVYVGMQAFSFPVVKLLIVGPPSTGKTWLAKKLAQRYTPLPSSAPFSHLLASSFAMHFRF